MKIGLNIMGYGNILSLLNSKYHMSVSQKHREEGISKYK